MFVIAGPCADLPRGSCGFLAWILLARAEPMRPVLELTRQARAQGVAVFFLTGRPERVRASTDANLKAAGYEWTGVLLKPDALTTPSAVDFKAAERRKLVEQGYVIVVNVGRSDERPRRRLLRADVQVAQPVLFRAVSRADAQAST